MGRLKLPTPLVTVQTLGTARPLGLPLAELGALYLASCEAQVRAGTLSVSRWRSVRRTVELARALPAYPEQGHVRQWLDNMGGRKPSTRRLHFHDLYGVFAWGLAANHCAHNPCYRLRYRVPPPKRHAMLDVYEKWPAMLAHAAGDDVRARGFLAVCRYSGLRVGEALALEARHVETWRAPWVLRVERQREASQLESRDRLKTPTSARQVPVRDELRELLAPVLALPAARVWVGRGGQSEVSTSLLFPFRQAEVDGLMARLREKWAADFPPDDAWHVWRHTVAVELYRWGREVLAISQFLGHESVAYTQKYLRGFLGGAAHAGIFDGMTGPPPWVKGPAVEAEPAAAVAVPPPRQVALGLGPLSVVQSRAGPPKAERSTKGVGSAPRRPSEVSRRGAVPESRGTVVQPAAQRKKAAR